LLFFKTKQVIKREQKQADSLEIKISLVVIHLASSLFPYYVEPGGQEQGKFVDVGEYKCDVSYLHLY
jgi:hypothetical protein